MKKIVLLTYEFTYSPFSGNGILARSLVKSFLGLECTVTVWCCRPTIENDVESTNSSDNHLAPPEISQGSMERLTLLSNVVQNHAWRRVDDQSCWSDFRANNLPLSDLGMLQTAISNADFLCVIDWSGAVAYRSILEYQTRQEEHDDAQISSKFQLYLNFRVFSSGVDDPKRREWYDAMEYKAMENADVVVSLSSKDTQQLSAILERKKEISINAQTQRIPIEIVVPPLRQDMESFAKISNSSKDFFEYLPKSIQSRITSRDGTDLFSKRPIIACVARQSPEKCIMRFVKFLEMTTNVLQSLNLTVVLAGAASDVDYAKNIRQRLLQAVPSAIVIDRFLSPKELGAVFAHTVLNFHPSSYDAYGMTIVEAAAFGSPSVIAGPSIGAFRLLGEDGCISVAMDANDENVFADSSLATVINFLRGCQKDETSWMQLSSLARRKALAWDEKSYGERMLQIVECSMNAKLR